MSTHSKTATHPGHHALPHGLDGEAILKAMPWLRAWLVSPEKRSLAKLAPRDFIHTPYALSVLGIPPGQSTFLDGISEPWVALQHVARRFFASQGDRLAQFDVLHACIADNNLKDVETQAPLSPLSLRGPHGHTALTLASVLGRDAMVDVLLAAGSPPNATDALENSPLHWAAIMGNDRLQQRLLAAGADGTLENLMGARAADYANAWQRQPASTPGIPMLGLDGNEHIPADRVAFQKAMGFEYLPQVRPGVDFFMQMLTGMATDGWLPPVQDELARAGTLPRPALVEPPLYLKDFGPPWGWGVCTRTPIATGSPVTTYVGDLIHTFEMTVDLFNLGFTLYTSNAQPSEFLQRAFLSHFDARRSGNLGSRINSAHVRGAENLSYRCRFWRGLPANIFYANRDIEAGEQLSWFYGEGYWNARGVEAQPLPRF